MDKKENLCATGYTIYLSIHETLLEMGQLDPTLAFEYYKALANYNFYGEEYSGDNMMIRFLAQQQYPLIDNQRQRYNQAVKGGQSKREQIPWEDIETEAKTGNYQTLQSLGVHFGTSGQNIGKRLKYKGVTLQELIEQGQKEINQKRRLSKQIAAEANRRLEEKIETANETFETNDETFETFETNTFSFKSNEERLQALIDLDENQGEQKC